MIRLLEKLFALVTVVPPLYMGLRWLRWYFRSRRAEENLEASES